MVLLPIFSAIDPSKSAVKPSSVVRSPSEPKSISPETASNKLPPVSVPTAKLEATPPPVNNPVKRVPGLGSIAIPSIFDMINGKSEDKVLEPSVSIQGAKVEPLCKPFTGEDLLLVWKKFVEQVDAPQLKSALSTREPKLNENWRIEYLLDNDVQLQRITLDLKPRLIGHLHRTLQNELIEIEFSVSENTEAISNRPYTDSEKWNLLAEKYPALATLKTKFNLDFEQS